MEDKNDGQNSNESGAPQSSENNGSKESGNGMTDKLIADVKKFNLMSLVGLGLVAAFLLFMIFNATNYKWWIMLPIAGAAGFILYRQLGDTQGFEKKACFYALIVISVLVLFRDIIISNAAVRGNAGTYSTMVKGYEEQIKRLNVSCVQQVKQAATSCKK